MQHLPTNTLLQNGKYKIERLLGQGGFGITYLATQVMLDRKVCIKEFFFKEYCDRTPTGSVISTTSSNKEIVMRFLNKFIKEARTISRLDHSNIIRILDIFEENGTAYYVMEYIDGCSLEDKVNRQGVLCENEAVEYVKQVGNALDYIHQNRINHLDVKPANIMIRKSDNKAILIDFGVSKQYDEQGSQTSTTPVGISYGYGYAPMEQYMPGGVNTFSPQTDIYALGATLYYLLTANTPPAPHQILTNGLIVPSHISTPLVKAIRQAMEQNKSKRPANISAFFFLLQINKIQINNGIKKLANSDNEETKVISKEDKCIETEIELKNRADQIYDMYYETTRRWAVLWFIISFLPFIPLFLFTDSQPLEEYQCTEIFYFLASFPFFSLVIGGFSLTFVKKYYIKNKLIKWKKQHPNDPVCKYIETNIRWSMDLF